MKGFSQLLLCKTMKNLKILYDSITKKKKYLKFKIILLRKI